MCLDLSGMHAAVLYLNRRETVARNGRPLTHAMVGAVMSDQTGEFNAIINQIAYASSPLLRWNLFVARFMIDPFMWECANESRVLTVIFYHITSLTNLCAPLYLPDAKFSFQLRAQPIKHTFSRMYTTKQACPYLVPSSV